MVALAVGFGLYGSLTLIPEILQAPRAAGYGFGVTVTDAGLFLLPQTAVVFVFGAIAGRISAAIGSARAVLIGVLLAAGSFGPLVPRRALLRGYFLGRYRSRSFARSVFPLRSLTIATFLARSRSAWPISAWEMRNSARSR